MDSSIENIIGGVLEKIAQGYLRAKKEWLSDKKNRFKDGRLLGYYEAQEAIIRAMNGNESANDTLETLAELYSRAKTDWLSDRRNPFKDGKFLACYEILNMIPASN